MELQTVTVTMTLRLQAGEYSLPDLQQAVIDAFEDRLWDGEEIVAVVATEE